MVSYSHVSDRPLGVFDSGIGGLTVASALRRYLPAEEILYLGDTARLPYGTKSPPIVRRFALEATLYLARHSVKAIVVACNTVSAVALSQLRELLAVPILGVIEPGVKEALKVSRNRHIGVIGTPSTIGSNAYQEMLTERDPEVKVEAVACPLFVALAEEGWVEGEVPYLVARHYLQPLKESGIDTLILGCTHYPLLKPIISQVLGEGISIVDSSEAVARAVNDFLLQQGLLKTYGKGGIALHITDRPRSFNRLVKRFFGEEIAEAKVVNMDEDSL